jgi:peptide subunit release factor 1 (eRF1)
MNNYSNEVGLGPDTRDVASLFAFRGDPYLVLSLYMDADARQQELAGVRSRSHSLLHQAREELMRRWDALEHGVREAALDDLERCRAFLDAFLPRGACRGLVLFSCTGRDWWQDYCLPRSVQDRWVWDSDPLVLPTLRLLQHYPRSGVPGREVALEALQERKRQEALLQQLYDLWRSGGYGIVGVPATVRALYLDEVQTLLVDAEFQRAGFRCANCGALSEAGERCPLCGLTDLRACPDLADEAIGDALARGGQVEVLEEPGELRGDGGMGALLRFRPQQPSAASPETRARIGER